MFKVQDLAAFRLPQGFRGRSALMVQLWWIVQATLFSLSPQVLYGWRRFLLRAFGAQIGTGVLLRSSVRVTYPWNLKVGDNAWIGDHVELYSLGHINIGDDAVVSQGSYLCTGTHDYTKPTFDIKTLPIIIEPEVWIASQVFVGPGVTIGRGTVVGVRSLVLKNLPEMVMAAGHPATILGPRL
jgi:putative colanic acid biosynthesis acetyltransferase WcaF